MRPVLTCLMILLTCGALLAQAPDSGDSVLQALSEKADRLDALWEAKNYEAAVGLLHEMKRDALRSHRQDLGAALAYTLGCGYSLLNDPSAALVQMSAAVDLGFSDYILMRGDPDLDNVRRLPEFEWLLQEAKEALRVDWNDVPGDPPTVLADGPDCQELRQLRREHDLDAVVAMDTAQANTVWLNDGRGYFSSHPTTPEFGAGDSHDVTLGDLDGDGDLDAVVANDNLQPNTVWLNDGAGNLTAHPTNPNFGEEYSRNIVLGDLDGDGDLDIVVNNRGSRETTVWLNEIQEYKVMLPLVMRNQ